MSLLRVSEVAAASRVGGGGGDAGGVVCSSVRAWRRDASVLAAVFSFQEERRWAVGEWRLLGYCLSVSQEEG